MQDTLFQCTLVGLILIDLGQTFDGIEKDGYREVNPILGENPTKGEVSRWAAVSIITTTAMAYILPRKYRTIFQSIVIGAELQAVRYNYQVGLSVNF